MKISVIIVSWNVKRLLQQAIEALLASDVAMPLEIIVVDSASHDGSAAMVASTFPTVKLIASPENLGYAGGNNAGAAAATGDFLFFLNPDTKVNGQTIAILADYLTQHPQVGAIGPKMYYGDGSIQSSVRRFPTVASMFWESTLLEQWFPDNAVSQAYKYSQRPLTEAIAVDWLVGAALFIRKSVWDSIGPLDEAYFMYFEETDWCRRCAEAGWAIHYVPGAELIHYEGQSSQQVVAARTIRFQRSKIRYAQKWLGSGWAWIIRLFLLANFALQYVAECGKWLVGHNRPLRRERMTAYWQVLKSGLAS